MKYREETPSRSHKSHQPTNRSLALSSAPSANRTPTLISNPICVPAPIASTSLTPIQKTIQQQEPTPIPRRYINPLSLHFSIINPKQVELIPTVEFNHIKPTHQPLLHSPPRSLAQIRVIPAQQPIPTTLQSIMSESIQQPIKADASKHPITSAEPEAIQQLDSTSLSTSRGVQGNL